MNFRKPRKIIKRFLKQGLKPRELALCLALTIYISVFPILGTITALLTLVMLRLRLNLPLAISVSYLLTPVQLLCMIPFLRIGETIYGVDPYPLDIDQLQASFSEGILEMLSLFSGRMLLAILGWLIVATPICLILYVILFKLAKIRKRNKLREERKSFNLKNN